MHLKYDELQSGLAEKLDKLFGVKGCLIEVNPGRVLLPPKYKDFGDRIYNMEVRPDDVWLVSYPRTGSTWAQEMVWCICNDLDFETAKTPSLFRNPLLELTALVGNDTGEWTECLGNTFEMVDTMASPRFIKTHLPANLLPKQLFEVKPKVIYVSRSPKDMCVSYYHYCRLLHDFKGTLEEFCEIFLQGRAPIGDYWDHVLGFWRRKDDPNVLFIKYEEMKKDHKEVIRRTARFLGKDLNEEQVDSLIDHLSFQKMRQNPALNLDALLQLRNGPQFEQKGDSTFIRKGQVGDWKNYMTPEIAARFDRWTEDNLRGTGLEF